MSSFCFLQVGGFPHSPTRPHPQIPTHLLIPHPLDKYFCSCVLFEVGGRTHKPNQQAQQHHRTVTASQTERPYPTPGSASSSTTPPAPPGPEPNEEQPTTPTELEQLRAQLKAVDNRMKAERTRERTTRRNLLTENLQKEYNTVCRMIVGAIIWVIFSFPLRKFWVFKKK